MPVDATLLVLDRLLVVDRTSGQTIVGQLVDGLRRGILDGALRTGDAVPSTRALAAELGVARSSVVAAYDQLAGEGYLELRQGAPTRVAALPAAALPTNTPPTNTPPANTLPVNAPPTNTPPTNTPPTPSPPTPSPPTPSPARQFAGLRATSDGAEDQQLAQSAGCDGTQAGERGGTRAGERGGTQAGEQAGTAVGGRGGLQARGYLGTNEGERYPADTFLPRSPAERQTPAPRAVVDLSPGVPSTARLDQRAWRAAWRAAGSAPLPSNAPPPSGLPELRAEVAEHLRLARGIACTADDVVVTAGTSEALELVALGLAELHGRPPELGVEEPGYTRGRRSLLRHGAILHPLPVGADGLKLNTLEAGAVEASTIDAVMVTPSHQYPLGGRLPVAERLTLLDWARRRDAFVVEDDYDSEFRHTGAPLPALASLDGGERVVLIGSFSKVLTPWLRLGYLVLPRHPRLRSAIATARAELDSPVAGPLQLAVAAFLRGGALRRHITATRREYRHRRALVLDALGGVDASARGVDLTALDGGLHAVLELPDRVSEQRLVARLAAEGIVVAPLAYYASDPEQGPAGIVLGYAGVSDLALVTALDRVRELVHELTRA